MINQFRERYRTAKKACKCCCEEVKISELSQADTFIEFCFEVECAHKYDGQSVLNEWRQHKSQYCSIMETIMYDFAHYSRHDESHSISILETMELIIGDERIVKLSRTDLWLLLECAYSHDIGMALTGEELSELWSNPDFKEYLLSCLSSKDPDEREAARYYQKMDNMLRMDPHERTKESEAYQSDDIFDECWPSYIVNYVKWLVAGYIRRQHGKRNLMVRHRIIDLYERKIPLRLYDIASLIAELHTQDYETLLGQLKYEEKGIRKEFVHPRFAAEMLRLGDVLDVENNRFSKYAVDHMIRMPSESVLHKMKHESINHIMISTREIQLEAESDDIEVCRCAQKWFDLVNKEVENLIYGWNEIAPPDLLGCTLQRSKCCVYFINDEHNKVRYDLAKQKYFEVDKEKLTDLMTGTNIYSSKMDFVREYLQNAMDATRIQMWIDIKDGLYEELIDPVIVSDSGLQPFDIPQSVYDQYKVTLKVEDIVGDYENVRIVIEDNGIGMEEDCVSVISTIGVGWRGRKKYDCVINEMPRWMRPTGGFGIGIQSAFMVTDMITIMTQTSDEVKGRKITLNSPRNGSEVVSEECFLGHHGTMVQMKVPREVFLKWNTYIKNNKSIDFKPIKSKAGDTFFEKENQLCFIKDILNDYLHEIIPSPFVNVRVKVQGYRSENISLGERGVCTERKTWNNRDYNIILCDDKTDNFQKLTFWDCQDNVFVQISLKRRDSEGKGIICYKDVRMTDIVIEPESLLKSLDFYIDFLGIKAKQSLKIHRNGFREDFNFKGYVIRYLQFYLQYYIDKSNEYTKEMRLLQMMYLHPMDRDHYKQYIGKNSEVFDNTFLNGFGITVDMEEEDDLTKDVKAPEEDEDQNSENTQDSNKDELDAVMGAIGRGTLQMNEKQFSMGEIYYNYFNDGVLLGCRDMIFVTSKSRESYADENETSYNLSDIQNAYFVKYYLDSENKQNISKDLVLDCLLEQGVVEDDFLWKMLSDHTDLLKEKVSVYNNVAEHGSLFRKVFWQYERKVGHKNQNTDLIDFCKESWDNGETIFDDFPQELSSLAVLEIPYSDQKIEDNVSYLIRPMSEKWVENFKQKIEYERTMGRLTIDKKLFTEMIMGKDIEHPTEYFGYLMHWVMNNAADRSMRGDAQAVWNQYRKYIFTIYEVNVSSYNKKLRRERKEEK